MISTDKLIICVAPNGSFMGKDKNPNIPIEPAEIADEVHRAWNEGASIAHIHARDKEGRATTNPKVFLEIKNRIREKGCDIIIQHSTSPGRGSNLEVSDGIKALEADPEMASVDIGVVVMMREGTESIIPWTRTFVEDQLMKKIVEKGIKPEFEVYTPAGLDEVQDLINKGLVKKPYWISFVMDMHRTIQNTVRYTPKNLMHYVDLLPTDAIFSTMAISYNELPAAVQSILLGGHVRVGFEDNLWYKKGALAGSNAELVARVARIGVELGRKIASPNETRELLGIKLR